ncbi:MAG TPA: gfo/Idh/MocA family oxidoreductase, partial [Porticoccaceae bacterium]|nr:gfo/Idh/MocA family oxidoreductase [Porticoccaceae bacterium]
IGQEHMYVCTLLGRGRVYGIYDQQLQSMDVAKQNFQSYSDQPLVLYPDIETLCNDVNVDAIMICTPNFTHFSILKQVMSSGKPIFIEKPMATNLENSASLVELASNYSSFVQIGLQYRYKAQYIEAFHELHSRQSIGDIKTISMSEY